MRRRDLLKGAALFPAAMAANADLPEHLWQGLDFGSGPPVRERLNQGPFDIGQDQGWQTILFITPSEKPIRNPGLGLVGYTCVGADHPYGGGIRQASFSCRQVTGGCSCWRKLKSVRE